MRFSRWRIPDYCIKICEELRFASSEDMKKDIFEFFDEFVAFDDLATFIARESIRYVHQNGRVFEITKEEVYAFYGIYLFMG